MIKITNNQVFNLKSWEGSIVHHFKGDDYLFMFIGRDSETKEPVAIYRGLYGSCDVWVRKLDDFVSECTEEQKNEFGQTHKFLPTILDSKRKEV